MHVDFSVVRLLTSICMLVLMFSSVEIISGNRQSCELGDTYSFQLASVIEGAQGSIYEVDIFAEAKFSVKAFHYTTPAKWNNASKTCNNDNLQISTSASVIKECLKNVYNKTVYNGSDVESWLAQWDDPDDRSKKRCTYVIFNGNDFENGTNIKCNNADNLRTYVCFVDLIPDTTTTSTSGSSGDSSGESWSMEQIAGIGTACCVAIIAVPVIITCFIRRMLTKREHNKRMETDFASTEKLQNPGSRNVSPLPRSDTSLGSPVDILRNNWIDSEADHPPPFPPPKFNDQGYKIQRDIWPSLPPTGDRIPSRQDEIMPDGIDNNRVIEVRPSLPDIEVPTRLPAKYERELWPAFPPRNGQTGHKYQTGGDVEQTNSPIQSEEVQTLSNQEELLPTFPDLGSSSDI